MDKGFRYYVHGLTLHSEIECPELPPAPPGPADVRVWLGSLADEARCEADRRQDHGTGKGRLLLHIRNAGRFAVSDGREIVVDPLPGMDARTLRLFLLGSALGCILHQRGLLPLHGNAFLHEGQAVLVVAHSGTGKSTLAAAMKRRGCPILADDVCAVRTMVGATPVVYPGIPQIKLWKDAADHLGEDTGAMGRVSHDEEKYALPVLARHHGQPWPIRAIYVLDIHDGTAPEMAAMTPLEKIDALRTHTFRKGMVTRLGTVSANLRACALLAQEVPMRRLLRPRAGFLLDDLADLMQRDLQ